MAEVQSGSENFLKAIENMPRNKEIKFALSLNPSKSKSLKRLKQKELEKPIPLFKEKWQP